VSHYRVASWDVLETVPASERSTFWNVTEPDTRRDIDVTAVLLARRWAGYLPDRRWAGAHERRWKGTLL
jgi:hypothetical protein